MLPTSSIEEKKEEGEGEEKKHRLITLSLLVSTVGWCRWVLGSRISKQYYYYYYRKCSITHVSVSLWLNKIVFAALAAAVAVQRQPNPWPAPKKRRTNSRRLVPNSTRTSHYYRLSFRFMCVRRAQHNKQIMYFAKINVFGFRSLLFFLSFFVVVYIRFHAECRWELYQWQRYSNIHCNYMLSKAIFQFASLAKWRHTHTHPKKKLLIRRARTRCGETNEMLEYDWCWQWDIPNRTIVYLQRTQVMDAKKGGGEGKGGRRQESKWNMHCASVVDVTDTIAWIHVRTKHAFENGKTSSCGWTKPNWTSRQHKIERRLLTMKQTNSLTFQAVHEV